jgi:hypothetical protein
MDQQSIVLYLSRNGLSSVAIHDDFVATLGAEMVSYPSVTLLFLSEVTDIMLRVLQFEIAVIINARI